MRSCPAAVAGVTRAGVTPMALASAVRRREILGAYIEAGRSEGVEVGNWRERVLGEAGSWRVEVAPWHPRDSEHREPP